MKTSKAIITLLYLITVVSPLKAEAEDAFPTAESVLNAFISVYAKESRYLKKEVTSITHPNQIQPGAQLGSAPYGIGYYSFYPKTWNELSDTEKSIVLNDPRLRAFIISSGYATTYPARTGGISPELDSAYYPVNGITRERSKADSFTPMTLRDAYTIKETARPEKPAETLEIKIPAHELVRDVQYDVFIEKVE